MTQPLDFREGRAPKLSATMSRRLSMCLGIAGVLAVTWFAISAWLNDEAVRPGPGQMALAAAFAGLTTICAAQSWTSLIEDPEERGFHTASFLMAQFARYLPVGGLAHAASQVALSSRRVAPLTATARYLAHAAVHLTAATTAGALLYGLINPRLIWLALVVAPLTVIAPMMIRRLALRRAGPDSATRIRRLTHLLMSVSARSLAVAWVWALVGTLANGLSWWVVSNAVGLRLGIPEAVAVFAIAWAVGFLAMPFPAGIGIRETVLSGLSNTSLQVVAAASLVQRLAALTTQGVIAIGAYVWYLRWQRRTGDAESGAPGSVEGTTGDQP